VPPGATITAGQFCVTAIAGAVTNEQVAVALVESGIPVQVSLALAVNVLVTEQASSGAMKLPVKLADPRGANVGTVKITVEPLRSFVTTTLVTVIFPELLTLPL
jgi:hypothetical protein